MENITVLAVTKILALRRGIFDISTQLDPALLEG